MPHGAPVQRNYDQGIPMDPNVVKKAYEKSEQLDAEKETLENKARIAKENYTEIPNIHSAKEWVVAENNFRKVSPYLTRAAGNLADATAAVVKFAPH